MYTLLNTDENLDHKESLKVDNKKAKHIELRVIKNKKVVKRLFENRFFLYLYISFLFISIFLILITLEFLIKMEKKYMNNNIKELIDFTNNILEQKYKDNNISDKNKNIIKEKETKDINIKNKTEKQPNNKTKEENILERKKEDIYKKEVFSSREEAYRKGKYFLNNNEKGILLQEIPQNISDNPIASAVIPVYNSKNYILRAIRSVQNQNISNIEIILVNDFSTDDTLSLIEEIQKNDTRIKIINNKKNMCILYSRCIGVLAAKGKYIFPLDNDDMFLDEDVFDVVTKIADKGDFDIVEFKAITTFNYKSGIYRNRVVDSAFSGHPLNLVLYQPELGRFQLKPGDTLNSYHIETVFLWAKCIKTEIYKKTINKLGAKKYSKCMYRHEDCLANYILFNTARSYKFIGKYGVNHIERDASASQSFTKVDEDIYNLYLLDAAIDFTLDFVENKKILVHLIVFLLSRNSLKDTLNYSEEIKNLFISCLDRILKMKNISEEHKNIIKDMGKKLSFINYPF